MKPAWKDAPEWANWRAMDEDGLWFWGEYEPSLHEGYNEWVANGRYEVAICAGEMGEAIDWRETKEERP